MFSFCFYKLEAQLNRTSHQQKGHFLFLWFKQLFKLMKMSIKFQFFYSLFVYLYQMAKL